jgi:ribosomal protein L40E
MALRLLARVAPNVVIIGFASSLLVVSNCVVIPHLLRFSSFPGVWRILWVLVLAGFLMWLWCWSVVIAGDPGSIRRDLGRRGVLRRVLQGDIPRCLRHLPLCAKCQLPQPWQASHCHACGSCFLRVDHHCPATGQCIADLNFKPFILSFFWAGVYRFLLAPGGIAAVTSRASIAPMVLAIYGVILGILMLVFGGAFLSQNRGNATAHDAVGGRRTRNASVRDIFDTFGESWWQRLLPIQRGPTVFAWAGVEWADEDGIPL